MPSSLKEAIKEKTVLDTIYIIQDFEIDILTSFLCPVSLNIQTCRSWKTLHKDLSSLIDTCLVKTVALVLNGNTRHIDEEALEEKKDITTKLQNNFFAIHKFRELLRGTKTNPDLFVSFVNPIDEIEFPSIGEVIANCSFESVSKSLSLYGKRKQLYFDTIKISNTTKSLYKHFFLNRVEDFYKAFEVQLEDIEFVFKKDLYQYDSYNQKLVLLKPDWAKKIKYVGDDYYEEVTQPTVVQTGKTDLGKVTKLELRKKSTLTSRFGSDFGVHVDYYQGFTNIPSHFDYKPILKTESGNFLNRYFPFVWEPKEGKFDTILKLIKHIFGDEESLYKGKTVKSWELGLDYVQLLLQKPHRRLPIVCLFSPENNTGKSTFALLLSNIFKNNCCAVSNNDFQSEFGASIFYDKLLAYCEETLLDKTRDIDQIKNMSTAPTLSVNPKGTTQFQGQTFVKFMFMSNNARMLRLTKDDERFWVLKVPPVAIEDRDPHMNKKMIEEIPAFVDFLMNREMVTSDDGRMWFDPRLIKTAAFDEMARISEHSDVRELREKLKDYFITHDVEQLIIPTDAIQRHFLKTNNTWLHEILRDRLGLAKVLGKTGKPKSVRAKYWWWADGAEAPILLTCKPAQCWIFERREFLDDNEHEKAGGQTTDEEFFNTHYPNS